MAAKRLRMRQLREVLRLKFEVGLSHRAIVRACGVGLGTVSDYVQRVEAAVTGQERAFLTDRSMTDRRGSEANRSFQSRGVSAATSLAGWRSTRCSTSTR